MFWGTEAQIMPCAARIPTLEFLLTFEDIDALIDRGFEVYNTYNQLFRASQQSPQIVGHDDFRHILEAIRGDRQCQEEMYSNLSREVTQQIVARSAYEH